MDDSEISILDSIRIFEKNLDFELRAIFTAYKGLKWRMRAMVSMACGKLCQYFSDSYACEPTIRPSQTLTEVSK